MGQGEYILNKSGWALFTVAFVVILNFFLFRVLPGDPAAAIGKDPRLKPEARAAIRDRFGLDKPLVINTEGGNPFDSQFFAYLGNLGRGDLGISFQFNRPVADLLGERLWSTLLLIGVGEILAIAIGLGLGVLAGWKRGSMIDLGTLLFGLLTYALPTFWLGIILLIFGSTYLELPVGGSQTPGARYASLAALLADRARHMAMPVFTFTIVYLGAYILIMRSALLEVLGEDYILTAKAKGLTQGEIVRRHALRNALLPVITLVAFNLGYVVAGAIEIETIFSWPGLGRAVYDAVQSRDYPMLQGAFLLLAVSVVLANLAAELLYAYLDPRVRTG
jgi:peptide/nickel transport system permease protein